MEWIVRGMDEETRKLVDDGFDSYLEELVQLVRKPSVSATGEGVEECANYLAGRMSSYGIETEILEVEGGQPVIIGEIGGDMEGPVLLVYDHYDVQPPEPLEEWEREPFSGEVSEGRVHGRGTTDSKGNLMAYLLAIRVLDEMGDFPLHVKLMFEGQEEIGSPNLRSFVNSHRELLEADAAVCCDAERDPSGRPMISLGMKGLIYLELESRKADRDAHSSKAALLPSAAWRLMQALNTLRDSHGRISIEGWEEGLVEPGEREMELMRNIPFDEEEVKREYGVSELLNGRHGLDALRGYLYEPTCNIAGLTSGYQGEGSKTVLPSQARAKMDMRLVYDQKADRCIELLRKHLSDNGFQDLEVKCLSKLEPSHTPVDAPIAKAAAAACREVYGQEAVIYPKHHASGPDYLFTKDLGIHSIWTGCPPADGHAHAPNEFIGPEDFRMGIMYACQIMRRFADQADGG